MSSASPLPADLAATIRAALVRPGPAAHLQPALQIPAGSVDAAVLVPLFVRDDELHVVLTQRTAGLRRHAGEISFPGGRQDDDEIDLRSTALREAHEEIGLAPAAVELLGELTPTPTVATNYTVHPFVGLIEPGRRWTLSSNEVDAVLEPTVVELRAGFGRRVLWRRNTPIPTDVYVLANAMVWGATARIVGDLLSRLAVAGI